MHDKIPMPTGKKSGFRTLLGYRNTVWREGHAEIELEIGPQHLNGMNILHGGAYLTLLDAACGHAATWCANPAHTRFCVTVGLSTSFIRPATAGLITATGRLEAVADRTATCRAEVRDATGRLLAAGQGSFLYMPGSEHLDGVPRPQ
jgi:uncharacterized protein (TIGR00369 family)